MTSYSTYPNLPSALPDAPPQVGYHLNVVQAKRRGLIGKEKVFQKKYKKYNKILNRLMYGCRNGAKFNILKFYSYSTFIHSYSTFVFVFSINICSKFDTYIYIQQFYLFTKLLSIQKLIYPFNNILFI